MPIEIRELVIRAVVEPPSSAAGDAPAADLAQDRAEIVEACVAAVMKALRRREER